MFNAFVYFKRNDEEDEKENWDIVLIQCKDNNITVSFVLSDTLEDKVIEFPCTAEGYMLHFRGYVDLDDGLFEFQRHQYDTLMEKYFK